MLVLKASVLLSAALVAARLLRRAAAATRHRLWTFVFAAVLALPFLALTLPALHVPMPGSFGGQMLLDTSPRAVEKPAPVVSAFEPDAQVSGRSSAARPESFDSPVIVWFDPSTGSRPITSGSGLLFAWLVGSVAAVASLVLSLARACRLAANGEDIDDPAWRRAADALAQRLGLGRSARLLVCADITTPMAGGLRRPLIFLPTCARGWTAEQRDVVLAHEIAHLARRDPLRHAMARLAVAFYWFHPLAWMAARQATVAREQACDEAVLALGTRPSAYARVLLDLAESIASPTPALAALPMVERSLLERRLMTILSDTTRPAISRWMVIPAMAALLLTLAVAAAQPVARASTRPAETPTPVAPLSVVSTVPLSTTPVPVKPSAPRAVAAIVAAPAQADLDRDSACWWDPRDGRSFSGSISSTSTGGRTVIYEQVGTRGPDRVIQKTFGDLRVCMLAEDVGDRGAADRPSQWLGRARRVIIETSRGSAVQRLVIARTGADTRTSWRVAGADRPFDAAAERWRDHALATLDAMWDLSMLRGEVSSLRGQISSIRGHESSIRGEISSLQGHVSSLRGAISSERGAISSLNGTRFRATDEELRQITARIGRHETEIAKIEQEIRDYNAEAKVAAVERQIRDLDTDGKIAAIDAEIRTFDLDGKIAAAEQRIRGLEVAGKIAAIEQQIGGLDADRRGRELEDRRDAELKQLEAAIAAIR